MKPVALGDTKNVVVVLHLDYQSAEWLATELYPDGLARDIYAALRRVDEATKGEEAGDD